MENTSERRFHKTNSTKKNVGSVANENDQITYYTNIQLGLYIVRGDTIVLLGQVGSQSIEDEKNKSAMVQKVDPNEFDAIVYADKAAKEVGCDGGEEQSTSSLDWDFDKDLLE